ncbi:hypothetical protein GCM10010172_58050 [Paractinoplanes ferrugineus]|uniref:RNA polymerase sigma factor 70 region 4 type 2 domain-containing protein n=2 Tax=Paractinoplanes ferrugineus TaxID=113564 RepID=A0A919JEV3_9ACTN|nr:hypothetical protein Afe05nite_77310 [Actinoplanes ferrugineus]
MVAQLGHTYLDTDAHLIERAPAAPELFTAIFDRHYRDIFSYVARLPEPVRAVLLLVAWAGLNQQEAAVALGIPAGTARSRLHRARQEMRQALGADIEMGE